MKRRTFLASGTAIGSTLIAGCSAEPINGDDGTPTDDTGTDDTTGGTMGEVQKDNSLVIATTEVFVDSPSDSAGPWVKDQFEAQYDAEVEWVVRDQGINYYIERHNQNVDIEPELYLNLRPHDLVRIDQNINDGELFVTTDQTNLENVGNIGEEFYFDPHDRVYPTWLSYCALVWNGVELDNPPQTFEDLTDPQYADKIALSNPQGGTTGLLFLLWTINEFGEDGYLEFWHDLIDNGARVLESWSEVYPLFQNGDREIVVSYSNDRVYAARFGNPLDKHQVAFLNGQGYANLMGIARFADGTKDDLAHRFMDFVLEPDVQAEVAARNVTGPVNHDADPPDVYSDYAEHPDDIVFYEYDALRDNMSDWLDQWARQVAGQY